MLYGAKRFKHVLLTDLPTPFQPLESLLRAVRFLSALPYPFLVQQPSSAEFPRVPTPFQPLLLLSRFLFDSPEAGRVSGRFPS